MPVTADKSGPYAPTKAILEIINRYRNRGLPIPVNAEVLARAGITDSLIPRTLQALETLDLIDESGKPTPTLEAIRLAPEAEYKKRLEDWLKSAYADVFAFVDPTQDNEIRIRDAFRNYQPVGQQPRMVSLFQGLCAAAGLIAEKPARQAPSSTPSPEMRTVARRVVAKHFNLPPRQTSIGTQTNLPAPLAGLLAKLPPEGESWTSEQRKKLLATFETVLDFCFPVVDDAEISDDPHEEEKKQTRRQ